MYIKIMNEKCIGFTINCGSGGVDDGEGGGGECTPILLTLPSAPPLPHYSKTNLFLAIVNI